MSQPGGRVCGFPSHLRTWLRSSPVICAVDAVVLLLSILVRTVQVRSLKRAADDILGARFDTTEELAELQSLEKQPVIRWALIVLPAGYQVAKLFGVRGLPWTLAWGGGYLLSFVVLEACWLLPLIGSLLERGYTRVSRTQWPGDHRVAPPQRLYFAVERVCGCFAVAGQCAIFIWTLDDLLYPDVPSKSTIYWATLTCVWFSMSMIVGYIISLLLRHVSFLQRQLLGQEAEGQGSELWSATLSSVLFLQVVVLGTAWYATRYNPEDSYLQDWAKNM